MTRRGGGDRRPVGLPDPLVIQTDWFPESEHGGLYEMVGEGYTVDTDQKVVRGPLIAGGEETGIDIEIRTGGPAIGIQPVSVQQYADDSIHLGYANTEGQILRYGETPVLSVVAPLEINPQIIFWDPETYPDVETLADLGERTSRSTSSRPGRSPTSSWPRASGTPTRSTRRTTAARPASSPRTGDRPAGLRLGPSRTRTRTSSRSGASRSPTRRSTTPGSRSTRRRWRSCPDRLEELRPCLEQFVPVVQQAAIDYIKAPDRANAIIIDAVEQYDTFWTYDEGLAKYSVDTQRELGIVGNGPDGTLGNLDEDRVQGVIDQIRDAGLDVPEDLTVDDLVTNEFVDTNIGL